MCYNVSIKKQNKTSLREDEDYTDPKWAIPAEPPEASSLTIARCVWKIVPTNQPTELGEVLKP